MENQWWVIKGNDLMEMLQRAHAGEDPDVIYIESYVNAEEREEM